MSLADNRKARFKYEILETFEGGLVLAGHEAKAAKAGRAQLDGSWVKVAGGEAFLVGAQIGPYQAGNAPEGFDPRQTRKILLSRRELAALERHLEKKGLTLVPLSLYNKGRLVKLSFGLARGKKSYDKRATIREREDDREIHRTLKRKR
jgi:SsrA-binding protein